MNKRLLAGIAAAGIIGGGVYGFAASLGTVDSDNLGAGNSIVASCDTDGITVDYTTSYATGTYNVDSVTLGGVAANCEGETIKVTLTNGTAALTSGTKVAGASGTETITVAPFDASQLAGAHVVISGDS